jgi:hypothetical protein
MQKNNPQAWATDTTKERVLYMPIPKPATVDRIAARSSMPVPEGG